MLSTLRNPNRTRNTTCFQCGVEGETKRCKCGTRYCSVSCQEEHWQEHKKECKLIQAMDKCLKELMEKWNEREHASFVHFTKADIIEIIEKNMRILEERPELGLYMKTMEMFSGLIEMGNADAQIRFVHYEVIEAYVKLMLTYTEHRSLKIKEWNMDLKDTAPRSMASIMIYVGNDHVDAILKTYAPDGAEPGWIAFHFFSYDTAIKCMDALAEVS